MAPSHYLNQCWNFVNWALGNKFQWNVNRYSYIFIQENAFENVISKMVAILSRPQCVNSYQNQAPIPVYILQVISPLYAHQLHGWHIHNTNSIKYLLWQKPITLKLQHKRIWPALLARKSIVPEMVGSYGSYVVPLWLQEIVIMKTHKYISD